MAKKKQNTKRLYPDIDPAYLEYMYAMENTLPEQYSLGGIAKDVAIGAGTGAISGAGVLSLPGALLGGGVGLVKGLFTHFSDKKEEKAEKERAQNIRNQGIATMQQTGSLNNYIPTFADGGLVPYGLVNAELEKEEVTEAKSGTMRKFNLPPHKSGSTEGQMSLEPGTRVYSDKLKNPATGNTFAKDAAKYKALKDRFNKMLDNPKSTLISRRTAERSLQNLQNKTDALFEAQEKLKLASGLENEGMEKALGDLIGKGVDFFKSDAGKSLIGGLTDLAPVAYNLFQGASKREQLRPQDFYNPMSASGLNDMANRSFNIDPLLAANRASQAMHDANVYNLASSGGSAMSNLHAGLNAKMAGDAAAYAQKSNMDNAYLGERAAYKDAMGQQMAATNLTIADINAQNQAAGRNFLGTGLSQLSQYSQVRRQDKHAREMDKLLIDKWGPINRDYLGAGTSRSYSGGNTSSFTNTGPFDLSVPTQTAYSRSSAPGFLRYAPNVNPMGAFGDSGLNRSNVLKSWRNSQKKKY